MFRAHRFAVLETALAISFWAVSFVYIKIALEEVTPVTLIVVRFAIGGLILATVAALRGELKKIRRFDVTGMLHLALVGVVLHQLLQVSGQALAEASVAAFLASTAPAFLVVLAALLLKEPLRRWQLVGVLLATGGAALVSMGGDWRALNLAQALKPGSLLVLLSAVVWALYSILNRYVVEGRSPASMTAGMMVFGFGLMLPLFIYQRGWLDLADVSRGGWGAILFVSIVCTAGAYLLYSDALERAPAGSLAAIQNIEPLVAMVAAALILGEAITVPLVIGGAAILAGVWLAERKNVEGGGVSVEGEEVERGV